MAHEALIDELRKTIAPVSDLPQEDLEWMVENGRLVELQPGESLFQKGDDANELFMMLSGEIQARRPESGLAALFIVRAGMVTGLLPYSRMTTYAATGYAIYPTRVFCFPKTKFEELLQRMPALGARLVGILTDRVRETTRTDTQRDKLMALGKLSAGLAHELNNPGSAAKRAAGKLCETLIELRDANRALDERDLTPAQRRLITSIEEEAAHRIEASTTPIDALTRSDDEERIASWLADAGVRDAWRFAPGLVDAGIAPHDLEPLVEAIGAEAVTDSLRRMAATVTLQRIAEEIDSATTRMTDIVRSIKEYSYMDQAPIQEIDVHAGIESTLLILAHKLKTKSITVERHLAEEMPKIQAYGSELNQVWTNLIDNAIDAMNDGGKLVIETCRAKDGGVAVEITDDGSGIPDATRAHIFEPFFTTKAMGEGTGLGLDTVYRIVRKHHGDISVESVPGKTTFTVRLPATLT